MDRNIPSSELKKSKRKRLIRYVEIVVILLSASIGFGFLMRESVSASDLIIGTADRGIIEVTVTGSGTVNPAFEEIITSPINSRILEVYCHSGDSVKAGTPLLLLDLQSTENDVTQLSNQIAMKNHELEQQRVNSDTRLSDLEMQVKVKEMTLSRLEVEYSNEKYLDSIGSGTGDRVRHAELAVGTGRLELEQMKQQLANEIRAANASENVKTLDIDIANRNLTEMLRTLRDARIMSPRNATLTFIQDRIGEKINEGQKIAVISDLSRFRVDGELADSYANRVGVGSQAIVKIGKEKLRGVISNLTPQSQNGIIKFTIQLEEDDHPRLRSGLKTDVYVACDVVDEAIRLPNGSFYSGPGTYNLFFLKEDNRTLEKREVKLGRSNYEFVEVKSGIKPGDRVVLSDMSRFKNSSILKMR